MNRSFLHACALMLPLCGGAVAWWAGAVEALRSAVAAGVLLGHLAVFDRMVSVLFASQGAPQVVAMTAARLPVTLLLGAAIVLVLGPTPATAAVACIVGGAVLYAAVDALHRADADDVARLGHAAALRESRC
jgi:hypothetical protein